jgi:O-antigen/teichoic acid export membrane protein
MEYAIIAAMISSAGMIVAYVWMLRTNDVPPEGRSYTWWAIAACVLLIGACIHALFAHNVSGLLIMLPVVIFIYAAGFIRRAAWRYDRYTKSKRR